MFLLLPEGDRALNADYVTEVRWSAGDSYGSVMAQLTDGRAITLQRGIATECAKAAVAWWAGQLTSPRTRQGDMAVASPYEAGA